MKKILIPIFILIIIVGISCFMFFKNDKNNNNINNGTEVINKEKESNNDEMIITEPKNEESIVENPKLEDKKVEHNEDNKPNNSNEKKDNNTKNDTTVVEKKEIVQTKENEWDKLGISEEDYYHKPMWSWARIDFSVEEYKTEEKTKEACVKKGQEVFEQGLGYSCTSINSYSGAYLGEMFKTF